MEKYDRQPPPVNPPPPAETEAAFLHALRARLVEVHALAEHIADYMGTLPAATASESAQVFANLCERMSDGCIRQLDEHLSHE